VVQLEGIETREEADNLRGSKLLVPAKDRPQLEEGEYHVGDLINLEVYHQLTGDKIGVVIDVYFAGNDLLAVQLHQKSAPNRLTIKILGLSDPTFCSTRLC
ncbi:MAG: 16S rRNA processing protein RimM, partial [Prochloron sp. SP5CPC1]|nr:16S rRNA processing protein RimM [Candidatus Paraprochloron terpiosi SP5CPC1]